MRKNKHLFIISWIFILLLTSFACRTLDGTSPSVENTALPENTPTATAEVEEATKVIPTATKTSTPVSEEMDDSQETTDPGEPQPTATLIPTGGNNPITLVYEDADGGGSGLSNLRPGPGVAAILQASAPIIDGDPGDWVGIWYTADYPTYGEGFFAGKKDLSAEFKLGWDAEYLYVGLHVRDSLFAQQASGSQIYRGDSLEILIDTDLGGDFSSNVLSGDDFQFGFSPGNLRSAAISESFVWAPKFAMGSFEMGQSAGRLTENGYYMEAAIPWASMDIDPHDGKHFGFLLSVSDNDTLSDNAQHTVVSFSPERLLHDPTSWKDLILRP
ncbi:MAG: hypothetical protein HON98_05760 [Chloroflexi bacterium]|jgi:hypothetical protein|nr:hypothetical protein [Chloroflexota bacterium]MBT3670534.1 hypothetical protein [Chloroflexota bacterium]MBT4001780.1 hypothetical protein [Chloroflexota bacterium]MBT4304169.1 hypothetical protein [Chloroflexota bacterium]MBT4533472.1 hypothetical protein [Chloroflexota bacterium]